MRQATVQYTGSQDLDVNISGFLRHLRSENLAERTQRTYLSQVTACPGYDPAKGQGRTTASSGDNLRQSSERSPWRY
jgi:hypothetical protein